MNQNKERITEELLALWAEYKRICDRFKYVTLWGMESRVPQHLLYRYPRNNELFHLLTAFVEETYDKAPRTCAYVTIAAVALWGISSLL